MGKTAKQAAGSKTKSKIAKQAAGSKAPAANPNPKKVKAKPKANALTGARTFKPQTAAQLLVAEITHGEDGKFTADGDVNQMAVATVLLVPFAAAFNDPPEAALHFGHKWLKEGLKQSLVMELNALQLDAVQSKDVIAAYVVKFGAFRKSDLRKLKVDKHDAEQASVPEDQRQTYRASETETFETKHGKTEAERKKEIAAKRYLDNMAPSNKKAKTAGVYKSRNGEGWTVQKTSQGIKLDRFFDTEEEAIAAAQSFVLNPQGYLDNNQSSPCPEIELLKI
jgi:hypothetical protein